MPQIFLCHASEDKPQVREVYARLKRLGFSPWLDEEEILPGQGWDYEIERALETSDFVLVFLSTRSVEKMGYVQREFRRALYHAEEMPEGRIHTIPVKLDNCAVPRRFSRHQWANLFEEGAFDRIVRALHYGLEQRDMPVPASPLPESPASEPRAAPTGPVEIEPRQEPSRQQRVTPQAEDVMQPTLPLEPEMIFIPAGEFLMGSDPAKDKQAFKNEQPQHTLSLPDYYLACEVE